MKNWKLDRVMRGGGFMLADATLSPSLLHGVAIITQRDAHPVYGRGITAAEALENAELIERAPQMDATLRRIAETMNGTEWNAETLDTIAAILRAAGFTLEDCH